MENTVEHWMQQLITVIYCCLLATLLLCERSLAQSPPAPSLDNWAKREYLETERTTPLNRIPPLASTVVSQGDWLVLPIQLPGKNEFFTEVQSDWLTWDTITVRLFLPAAFPRSSEVYFFAKDWDDLWLQCRVALVGDVNPEHVDVRQPSDAKFEFTLPVSDRAATRIWKPKHHLRPWHQLTPKQIVEFGVKINSAEAEPQSYDGLVYITGITLGRAVRTPDKMPRFVENVIYWPESPQVGDKVEVSFQVTHPYSDPFSREDVDLRAAITRPNGGPLNISAFYYEDFLYDDLDAQAKLLPSGRPEFRVRFTPTAPGRHVIRISGQIGSETITLPAKTFDVGKPAKPWKGFIRVSSKDARFLAYSQDGSEYRGVGINMRSPFDTRYIENYPFSRWQREDLNLYKRLFKKYAESGINLTEVWMSSWWLALEWIPDAPGNHGIGYMNQWRAWKLDRIFDWAAEYGLHIILLFNNHGKFSNDIDREWDRNPFNETHGGPFKSPNEYFHKKEGKQAFRKLADYVVSRWGYSPNLFSWKLFSEIDLTGDKGQMRSWYRNPVVKDWHREMGRYLKSIDPNKHLVTTHWATDYAIVNKNLAEIPELDFVTIDAYLPNKNVGAKRLFHLIHESSVFAEKMKKPCFVTEFGGSPHGDTVPQTLSQLHLGMWTGLFGGMAVPPLFWWFPLVEEMDLYFEFRALANYTSGEQFSGAKSSVHKVLYPELILCKLARDDANWLWLFDKEYFFAARVNAISKRHGDVIVELTGLSRGSYAVEFWNCTDGSIISDSRIEITAGTGSYQLVLPPFERDIAVKVKRTL